MLYIELIRCKPNGYKENQTLVWHVGEPVPQVSEMDAIKSVQADGDELLHIADHFPNLPRSRKSVNLWQGDLATFIAHNL